MITQVDDILREIPNFDDSMALAENIDAMANQKIPFDIDELREAAENLRGMWHLLRSARFHLATKARGE